MMGDARITKEVIMHSYLKRKLPADAYDAALLIIKSRQYNSGMKAKKICKATSEGTKVTWVPFEDDDDRKAVLEELKAHNKRHDLLYGGNVLKFNNEEDQEDDHDEA